MSQEFNNIMKFFEMSPEKKAGNLKDVFAESIEFFERFKYVLQNGTPEEKKAIFDEVAKLKAKLQEETNKMKEITGLSEDELKSFALNPGNFSDDEWGVIKSAKTQLDSQAQEINSIVRGSEGEAPKAPKKKGSSGSKKKWVKS